MSKLVDCLSYEWLLPVSRGGTRYHYVRRDGAVGAFGRSAPALCGELGQEDRHGVPKWRVLTSPASGGACGTCQSLACTAPTRVDWSGGPERAARNKGNG